MYRITLGKQLLTTMDFCGEDRVIFSNLIRKSVVERLFLQVYNNIITMHLETRLGKGILESEYTRVGPLLFALTHIEDSLTLSTGIIYIKATMATATTTITIPELSEVDYRKLISKPLIRVCLISTIRIYVFLDIISLRLTKEASYSWIRTKTTFWYQSFA